MQPVAPPVSVGTVQPTYVPIMLNGAPTNVYMPQVPAPFYQPMPYGNGSCYIVSNIMLNLNGCIEPILVFTDVSTLHDAWIKLCGAITSWNRSISITNNEPQFMSMGQRNQYDPFRATDYGALLPIYAYNAGSTAT